MLHKRFLTHVFNLSFKNALYDLQQKNRHSTEKNVKDLIVSQSYEYEDLKDQQVIYTSEIEIFLQMDDLQN